MTATELSKKLIQLWQMAEWDSLDEFLSEDFDKNDFLSFVKVTAEEVRPWETNFEIINELQLGNVTVI